MDARPTKNGKLIDPAIVAAICALPRDFHAGAGSPIRLVQQSGYRGVHDAISAADIAQHLIADPSLIDEWQRWSWDKRTSEGWYLQLHGEGGYIGYVGRTDPEVYFSSRTEAVAHFILREIASIDALDSHRDRTT